jgi:hypothetical protein
MKRTLTVKTERLAELTTDDLGSVAGASAPTCVTREFCRTSDFVNSLCCGTEWCTASGC